RRSLGRDRRAARERIATAMERRRWTLERFLERGKRLADVDQHGFVVGGRGCGAEAAAIAARELIIVAHELGHVARGRCELARVEDRTNALRPEAVRAARPAEPAAKAHVHQRRDVAI